MNRSIQQTNQIFNSNRMNRNARNGNNRLRPYTRNDQRDKMRRPFQNSKFTHTRTQEQVLYNERQFSQ